MARSVDLVDVIERIYAPAESRDAWRLQVADAVRPLLDVDGLGFGSHTFDAREPARALVCDLASRGGVTTPTSRLPEAHATSDAETIVRLYDGPAASSLSSRGLLEHPAFLEVWKPHGAEDVVSLRVDEEWMRGWIIFAPRTRETRFSPAERATLARIARHIATATRLFDDARREERVEAVLAPDGRVEDACGVARERAAREALQYGARRIDKARGRLRRLSADEAIAEWRALVDGRWSLVEHLDHDDRRYLLAIRNEPSARGTHALSKREREVCGLVALGHANKLVAYELGLSTATVATHVASAMRKLGVRTRVELVARWNALPRKG